MRYGGGIESRLLVAVAIFPTVSVVGRAILTVLRMLCILGLLIRGSGVGMARLPVLLTASEGS